MSAVATSIPSVGAAAAPRRRRRRIGPASIAILAFLSMAALFFSVPLYVIVATSFKTMDEIRLGAIFQWPETFTLDAWRIAWSQACSGMDCSGVSTGFANSIAILVPSLVLSIALSLVTGYALALWRIAFANGFLFVLFLCAFVPLQIIMYPLIKLTGAFGLYGSTLGIAVVHAVLAMPILTLIFRNFFKGVPNEIVAAALIDSGSFWRIFLEIILPMSGNILIVVAILQVTSIWNDFLVGLTFGGIGAQPMTVILNNIALTTTGEKQYNVDMAAALITALPPLAIYFLLGRFFVQGITAGAVKG
jgi:glucose/mannose transport system permease protein